MSAKRKREPGTAMRFHHRERTPGKAIPWSKAAIHARRAIALLREAKSELTQSFDLADSGMPESSWPIDDGIRSALWDARSRVASWLGLLEHGRDPD